MDTGEYKGGASDSVDLSVHRELICLLFGSPSVPLVNGLVALVTAGILQQIFPLWITLAWLAAMLAIVAFRLVLWAKFGTGGNAPEDLDKWASRYTLATVVTGGLWGLVASTALVATEPIYYLFAAFVVAGLCAGAAIRLSPHPPAFYAYIFTSATPMVFFLLMLGRVIPIAMGGLMLTFIAVMILVGRENHQRLADYIRLKNEQVILNTELQQATFNLTKQITEREKIALALEESSDRLRAIGDHALDAIIIADADSRVAYWNPAAERTFGFTARESMGRRIQDLVVPSRDKESVAQQIGRFASFGHDDVIGKTLRLTALRKDGTEFPADLSVSAMHLGGQWHTLGIVRDVSDQERTLASLRRREFDLTAIATLSDQLQSCRTIAEGSPIIADHAAILFPMTCGSIAIVSAETKDLVQVSAWGSNVPSSLAQFREADCRALRENREFESAGSSIAEQCEHLLASQGKPSLCLPLKVQGKTIGLVNLILVEGNAFDDTTRQVLHSFADVVKLSLANLQLIDSLAEQAFRDPLTGLFNRRYLMETLPREVRRAQRRNTPLTIVMLDIDHFKQLNDTYGHDAGDFVLEDLAEQLTEALRIEDVACRYGGEEFLLLLPDCDLATARRRMKSISHKIKLKSNVFHGKILHGMTLSIGLAALSDGLSTGERLITAADKAMYVAKRMGRDRIECFEASPPEPRASESQ